MSFKIVFVSCWNSMYQLGIFDAESKLGQTIRCWQKLSKSTNQRVYQDLEYRERTFVKNSYKRSRTSLPSPPLIFIAFFTSLRSPLSELLEQANLKAATSVTHLMVVGTSFPGLSPVMVVSQTTGSKFSQQTMCGKLCFIFLISHSRKFST